MAIFRVCDYISRVAVESRIKDRDYPSIFSAWHSDILNLPNLSDDEKLIHHDLFWSGPGFHLQWYPTSKGLRLFGRVDDAHWKREHRLSKNPNFIRLVSLGYTSANPSDYSEDWQYWIRDEKRQSSSSLRWNFSLPDRLHTPCRTGHPHSESPCCSRNVVSTTVSSWVGGRKTRLRLIMTKGVYYRNVEAERSARISMVRRIREAVDDDFLIIVNTEPK